MFILFLTNVLLSCATQKTTQQASNLYRKWQLLTIDFSDKKPAISYKDKKLFVTFYKDGRMEFNLDVNS
jgi:hypothetical protein